MSAERSSAGGSQHWEFKAHFRRNAFGWRTQPAIQRIKQALARSRPSLVWEVLRGALGLS